MCGIVGYIGNKDAAEILVNGLKKLEYRGYDSAGVCFASPKLSAEAGVAGSPLTILKRKGKVEELDGLIRTNKPMGGIGIAHTRWATHGQPNEVNAHPHADCTGAIAIVHNGIVENFSALKELLVNEGHRIVSETDSEMIAHLVEKFYQGSLENAVVQALTLIEGTYGLLIMRKDHQEIIAAKKSSPLLIGVANDHMLLASDASAVVEHTNRVIYLDDQEVATVTQTGYSVKNIDGRVVDKAIQELQLSVAQIEKRGYKHFMLKEIFEQPEALENTLRGRLADSKITLSINVDMSTIDRIIITACGTSWHSGLLAKYLLESMTGIPVQVDYASEFRYRNPIVRPSDLVIVISQSGETADTLAALKEAKAKGAHTLGIINVVGSTIAREVDSGIYLHAGPEIGVASTKAFTCQVAALLLFGLWVQSRRGPTSADLVGELQKLPNAMRQVLKKSEEIRTIVEQFKDSKNFLYLGRNVNFPVALEGALKLKEISYIHAEGYPAAEMKHGPIALVDENMPVVFICPHDDTYQKIISNMQEIKARGGRIIAITDGADEMLKNLAEWIIEVPKTVPELSPILNVVPLQLLAYHMADLKGINVDKPRNLAKSVTVE